MIPHTTQLLALFLVIFSNVSSVVNSEINPTVQTRLGLIRGLKAEDGDYHMYMGIPYAQVNETNPFGKAIPQEPFDGVFDAIDDSAICPQIEEFNNTIVGNLDCLHLNIYTPVPTTPEDLKPVMVMIFGGGFSIGFAGRYLYGPKYLVRHDVILVTLNYRLGPYGYMCLGTPEVPGNEGFKDQMLALRWINENIEAFGGNPNQITLFGNSAGGMSVDLHILSHHEKLFNQAILQSGTSLSITHSLPDKNAPLVLANHFGLITDDIYEATTHLATIDTDLIIAATFNLSLGFGPCLEEQFEGIKSFLTDDWILAEIPKVKDMPILIGITNHELLSLINTTEIYQNFIIHAILNNYFNVNDPSFEGMNEIMHRFYLGDKDISVDEAMDVIDFISDIIFIHATYRSIEKYLNNDAGDIFFYMFSYVGDRNFIRHKNNIPSTLGRAAHADELGYLFDISYFKDTPTAEDQLIIDRMTTLWTNFAKFGNPTPESSALLPVVWQPIRNNSIYNFMELDLELRPGTRPFHDRMSFIDLFFEANAHLQRFEPPSN